MSKANLDFRIVWTFIKCFVAFVVLFAWFVESIYNALG